MPDAERSGRRQGHRRNNAAVKGQKPDCQLGCGRIRPCFVLAERCSALGLAQGCGDRLVLDHLATGSAPAHRRSGLPSGWNNAKAMGPGHGCPRGARRWTEKHEYARVQRASTAQVPDGVRLTRCKVCLKGATRDTNAASFDTVSRRTLCPSVVRNAMATWSNESYEHGCCVTRGCHVRRRRRRMLPGSAPLRVDRLQCEDDVRSREGRAGDGSEALRANLRSKAEDGCQCVTGLASLAKAAWLVGCGRAIPGVFFPRARPPGWKLVKIKSTAETWLCVEIWRSTANPC